MGARARNTASGNSVEEEWEQESDVKIQMIIAKWWERSLRKIAGEFDNEEGSGWGCDWVPSGCKRDIDKRDIDSGNGLGSGKSDMLGDSADGWKGEEPGNFLLSTRIQLAEERVLHQIPEGRKRPRR